MIQLDTYNLIKKEVANINELIHSARQFIAIMTAGCAIPIIEMLFGAHTITKPLLIIFVLLLLIDWIAGRRVATKTDTKSSKYGIDGAIRTITMFLFLIAGNMVDILIGSTVPFAFSIAIATVMLPTLESVIANIKLAGWDSHIKVEWLKKVLDVLTKWVESEIEYKQARIKNRQEEKREQHETESD